jgi:site-specific DNA-cytosine methylase
MDRPNLPLISAEAILRSRSGRSLARPDEPITAENVEEFSPTQETIAEASRRLEELGFAVSPSGVTLTVLGEPTRFERVFGVMLAMGKDEHAGGPTIQPQGELAMPDSLEALVEEIVFPEPPEFFS